MSEAKLSRTLTQAAAVLEMNLKVGTIEETIEALKELEAKLKPNMLSPVSSNFTPTAFQDLIGCILHLCHSDNPEFQTLFRRFLSHWLMLCASFSVRNFTTMVQNLTETPEQREGNGALLFFISNALKQMDGESTKALVKTCAELVKFCPIDYIIDSSNLLWIRMSDFLSTDDIEAVLNELEDVALAPKAALLCRKESQVLVPKLFSRVTLRYISVFLANFPVDCEFDSLDLSARVAEGINLDDNDELTNALKVLPLLIERASALKHEEELTSLRPIWKGIIKKIPKCPEGTQYLLIHCLLVAEKEHLLDLDEILQFLEFSGDQPPLVQHGLLLVIFSGLSNETIQKEMFNFMKVVATDRDKELFLVLISGVIKHYSELKAINEAETQSVIHKILVPPSKDPEIKTEAFRLQLQCGLFTKDEMQKACEEFIFNNPAETVIELVRQQNIRIPVSKLDWFNSSMTHLNFRIVDSHVDPYLVLELLENHLIEPENIDSALSCLLQKKEQVGPLVFASLFSTLVRAVQCFGQSVQAWDNEIIDIVEHSKSWFEDEQMYALFRNGLAVFDETQFGAFIDSLLKYIVIFKSSVTFQSSIVYVLIMICKIVGPLIPSRALSLICAFLPDVMKETVAMDKAMKARITENVRLFFKNDFRESSEKELSLVAIKVFRENIPSPFLEDVVMKQVRADKDVANAWSEMALKATADPSEAPVEKPKEAVSEATPTDSEPTFSYEEKHFVYEEPVIAKGISFHGSEEPTEAGMIAFLWHSSLDLPEGVSFEDVQSFVLQRLSNTKLLAGFLAFAKARSYAIDIDAFASGIVVNRKDYLSLYSAIVLLSFVRGPFALISAPVSKFIESALAELGCYTLDKDSVRRTLEESTQFSHVLIESILDIDRAHFKYYSKETIFEWVLDAVDGRTTLEDYGRIVSALSATVIVNQGEVKPAYYLPTIDTSLHRRLCTFVSLDDPRKLSPISEEFAEDLVEQLARELVVSKEMINCVLSMALPDTAFSRFISILPEKLPDCQDFVIYPLLRSVDLALDYVKSNWKGVSPSFLRGLIRRLISTEQIPSSTIWDQICEQTGLKGIHAGLCYRDSNRFGSVAYNSIDVCDLLDMGVCNLQTIMTAHTEMFTESQRQPRVFLSAVGVPDAVIESLHAWKSPEEEREEFCDLMVDCLSRSNPSASFASAAMTALVEPVSPQHMQRILLTPAFIAKPNTLSICIALNHLRGMNRESAEALQAFFARDDIECDEDMRAILRGSKEQDLIAKIVHRC